jgi:hypothetical protein
MKGNNPENQKLMYSISFLALVLGTFLLVFVGFNTSNSITGNIIAESLPSETDEVIENEPNIMENISLETTLNAILQAEKDLEEMQEAGFGIIWFNDTLIEAKKYLEGEDYTTLLAEIEKTNDTERIGQARALLLAAQKKIGVEVDYEKVLEKTQAIAERKRTAYEINDMIRAAELRLGDFKQQDLDTAQAEEILSNAINEFENERFENIEVILGSMDKKLIDLSAETTIGKTIYRAGKENIAVFLKDHYIPLLLLFGLFLIIAILTYNRIKISVLRHKIRDMEVERDILGELMTKAQSDYFAKGDITKQTFKIKMAKFKEKLVEIKQKLPVAETLLDKRLKAKRVL